MTRFRLKAVQRTCMRAWRLVSRCTRRRDPRLCLSDLGKLKISSTPIGKKHLVVTRSLSGLSLRLEDAGKLVVTENKPGIVEWNEGYRRMVGLKEPRSAHRSRLDEVAKLTLSLVLLSGSKIRQSKFVAARYSGCCSFRFFQRPIAVA